MSSATVSVVGSSARCWADERVVMLTAGENIPGIVLCWHERIILSMERIENFPYARELLSSRFCRLCQVITYKPNQRAGDITW